MNPIIKSILAVVLGWLVGSILNMGLIQAGHVLIPIEGLDPNDMNALAKGPLPEEMVAAYDQGWTLCREIAPEFQRGVSGSGAGQYA